jgi:hypothetical protein
MFLVVFITFFLHYANNTNAFITLEFRAFCDVAPCSHVEVDRRFRGAYSLRHFKLRPSSTCIQLHQIGLLCL